MSTRVVFRTRIYGEGQKVSEVEAGRVELLNGSIVFIPEELKEVLLSENPLYGKKLDPKDGTRFLELLPQLFTGAYFRAVLERSES